MFVVVDEDAQRMCQFRDEDDCVFYFAYEYNSNRVYAQRTQGTVVSYQLSY